jgi:Flp pilus assembly protein CpaB
VVVARTPVAIGQVITAADLGEKAVSVGDGLASVSWARRDDVVGKVATAPLYPGQLLHPQAAAAAPPLEAGEVAMTLALSREQAVGGMLRTGDLVAVLAAPGSLGGATAAGEVLSRVGVLAVRDRPTAGGEAGDLLVTVRLPAADAARLQAAYRAGKIDLVLEAR